MPQQEIYILQFPEFKTVKRSKAIHKFQLLPLDQKLLCKFKLQYTVKPLYNNNLHKNDQHITLFYSECVDNRIIVLIIIFKKGSYFNISRAQSSRSGAQALMLV